MTVKTDLTKTEKSKFQIGTGAEISTVKSTKLKAGLKYEPTKGINVKVISNVLLRSDGTITLKLLTPTRENPCFMSWEIVLTANMMEF